VTPSIAQKYDIEVPDYGGVDQIVELPLHGQHLWLNSEHPLFKMEAHGLLALGTYLSSRGVCLGTLQTTGERGCCLGRLI